MTADELFFALSLLLLLALGEEREMRWLRAQIAKERVRRLTESGECPVSTVEPYRYTTRVKTDVPI